MLDENPSMEAGEGRRARRRRELHTRILDTAAELFGRDGYEATTVDKIAESADIVPATFFNHFPSKEDVLREVGQEVFSRFHRLVSEQLERPGPAAGRLRGFAERSAQLISRAPDLTRRVLIAVLRSSRPGDSGAELQSMQQDFAELLRRGVEAGDVRVDLDVALTAEILVSVVIGAMTHWINDPDYPLESRLGASLGLVADRLLSPVSSAPQRSQPDPMAPEPGAHRRTA